MRRVQAFIVSVVGVAVVAVLLVSGSAVAAGPGQYGAPSWFPLRHNANGGSFKVSCVRTNCSGPYHGYWAIDLSDPAAKPGAPVFAAGAGQVVGAVSSYSACGGPGTPANYVNVDHGNGVISRYLHLNTINVAVGQWVDQNTQIGTVGSVGYTDPCPAYHLHFQVNKNGTASDPGPLTACHGGSVVTYPNALGYGSWDQIPALSQSVYSDSSSCGTPPPPPDGDGDGVADASDSCPGEAGPAEYAGCPAEIADIQPVSRADFSGDDKADYCRVVGGGADQHVSCTLSAGSGFAQTVLSPVLDWGYPIGRAWTDFNGDGKADFCRRVGNQNNVSSYVSCTLSTGGGFGATVQSPMVDWGYDLGRAWVDFNGDGKSDYCRVVGGGADQHVSCTLSAGSGFAQTVLSPVLDWGYPIGRAWTDFNGDGKADFCRRVGNQNNVSSYVSCTVSTGGGFGATVQSPMVDWGYDAGRAWVDFNGDGKSDYCRVVGGGADRHVSCTLSTGTGFGQTVMSPTLDWGYSLGRAWTDFNGDGKSDYCRVVGGGADQHVSCTLSTGTGFGQTILSPVLDWGYAPGRGWVDFNGDRKTDFCRRVGNQNNVSSYVSCTLSTGDGFGATLQSPMVDWGYDLGRAWVGTGPLPTTTNTTTNPAVAQPTGSSVQGVKKAKVTKACKAARTNVKRARARMLAARKRARRAHHRGRAQRTYRARLKTYNKALNRRSRRC